MPTATPAHPVLERYYRHERDRDSFVATLFDGADLRIGFEDNEIHK